MTDETLLHRQVNPAWIQNNRPTSQTFRPTPKDKQQLSVYDGDLISAEAAWTHFIGRGYKSSGVLAVTVSNCKDVELAACASPEVFTEHAHIDFSGHTEGQMKSKGKRLLAAAEARGWQFRSGE